MQPTSLTLYMQTQRALYAQRLPDKIVALESVLQQLDDASDAVAKEAALSAVALAHKLAGSGGTFGFREVS